MAETQTEGRKKARMAMPSRWGLAEEKRRDHVVEAEIGVTVDDILEPSYWSHLAPEFAPLDKIEVRAEDGSWIANLRVLYAERNYAKVILEGPIFQIGEAVETANPKAKHTVEWKGGVLQYAVIRKADQQMVSSKHKNAADANAWMVEHEKATRVA